MITEGVSLWHVLYIYYLNRKELVHVEVSLLTEFCFVVSGWEKEQWIISDAAKRTGTVSFCYAKLKLSFNCLEEMLSA